jgi:hypothetical protein
LTADESNSTSNRCELDSDARRPDDDFGSLIAGKPRSTEDERSGWRHRCTLTIDCAKPPSYGSDFISSSRGFTSAERGSPRGADDLVSGV